MQGRPLLIRSLTLAVILAVTSSLVTPISAAGMPATTQARLAALLQQEEWPPSQQEAQAAWDSLSDGDRQIAVDVFEEGVLDPVIAQGQLPEPSIPASDTLGQGSQTVQAETLGGSSRDGLSLVEYSSLASDLAATPVLGFGEPSQDTDGDALPQALEDTLAQSFMPDYHVSAGEKPEVGFSRFADQPELHAGPVLRQQPPLVHTRVTGVGGRWEGGVLNGYIRADYLTLWNRDSGYDTPAPCRLFTRWFDPHDNDVERSALLLAAPVVWSDGRPRYNPDPAAYRAYYQFTTAHEDFPLTSEDRFLRINPPSPPDDHASLTLYLSKSKHGTYPFNPDGHEVIVEAVRVTLFVTTAELALVTLIEDIIGPFQVNRTRLIVLSAFLVATAFFETCLTESFTEQGGTVPTDPLNLGEDRHPLPGFTFAAHGEVKGKLIGPPVRPPRGTRDCGYSWNATKVFQPDENYAGCRGLFIMQSDGNLVYYDQYDFPRWASGTVGYPGAYAVFQDDGNLVVYAPWGQALWASGSNGRAAGGRLVFQDDGNLVIYAASGSVVWDRFNGLVPPPPPPPPTTRPPRCIIACFE